VSKHILFDGKKWFPKIQNLKLASPILSKFMGKIKKNKHARILCRKIAVVCQKLQFFAAQTF